MNDERHGRNPADVDRMADYVAGHMDRASRTDFERRLLDDPELAQALYEELGVDALLRRPSASRDVRHDTRGRAPRRRWWWAAPAVAAVLVLFLWSRPPDEPGPPVFRGDTARLEVVGPRGTVQGSDLVFRWRAAEGARRYQVELFDSRSRRMLREATADTFLRIDASVPATEGLGFWRVVARDSLAATIAASDPVPLTIVP